MARAGHCWEAKQLRNDGHKQPPTSAASRCSVQAIPAESEPKSWMLLKRLTASAHVVCSHREWVLQGVFGMRQAARCSGSLCLLGFRPRVISIALLGEQSTSPT